MDTRDLGLVVAGAGAGAASVTAYQAWRAATERTVLDGKPTTLARVDAGRVIADPETFQFKSGGDAKGVTDRLKGVKSWNPAAAGKVMVFERADGQQVIADGHQRTGLAKRLMSDGHAPIKMDALVLREADGWSPRDVRAYAAIKNMHESSGNALDMAKIMRERPDLVTSSLPMSDAKVREASALSRLSDKAFGMVVGGGVEPGAAAAVGEAVKDATRHADMIAEMSEAKVHAVNAEMAQKYPGMNPGWSDAAREASAEVRAAGSDTVKWLADRDERIRQSKAAGATHLDGLPRAVEGMRGVAFHNVHDPKERGVVRTVANTGEVVVDWADEYSAKKNLAETVKDGKKTVARSWLAPTDLKDYAVGQGDVPAAPTAAKRKAKPEPRGMDGLTRAERSGRVAPLAVEPVTSGGSTLERFRATYEKALTEQVKANPGKYAYGVERAPEMARRMTEALASGGGDVQSPTVRAAAKALGINPTVGGIKAALNDQPPPAPKPKAPGLSAREMGAVQRAIKSGAAVNQSLVSKATNAQLQALDDVSREARRAQTGNGNADWSKIKGIEDWRSAIQGAARQQTSNVVTQAPTFTARPGIADADGNIWRERSDGGWSVDKISAQAGLAKAAPTGDASTARKLRAMTRGKSPAELASTLGNREVSAPGPMKAQAMSDAYGRLANRYGAGQTDDKAAWAARRRDKWAAVAKKADAPVKVADAVKHPGTPIPKPPGNIAAAELSPTATVKMMGIPADGSKPFVMAILDMAGDKKAAAERNWRGNAHLYTQKLAGYELVDKSGNKLLGWSDAAREGSAKSRGVALPGEAKPAVPVKAGVTRAQILRMANDGIPKGQRITKVAEATYVLKSTHGSVDDAFKRYAELGMFGPKAPAPEPALPKPVAASPKTAKPGTLADLRAQAKAAGINLAGAKTKAQVQDALARGKPGVVSSSKYGALGKKALGILGPVGIVGAGAIAFDATRNQAHAAGKSSTEANASAVAAGAMASGSIAAVGYGITKAVQGAAKIAPAAGKVLAKAVPAVAAIAAVYEAGKGAVKGYKDGGGLVGAAKGAAVGVADFATMGAYSHFTGKPGDGQQGRLSLAQQQTFATSQASYDAMQAAKPEPKAAGWSDEARIAAYQARMNNAGKTAVNLPYGGVARDVAAPEPVPAKKKDATR